MARLSDIIEEFIKDMFNEQRKDEILIQRNELANMFECAPSQINYVLTTRFTSNKGYYVESKRGGGGGIKIIRANLLENSSVENMILENIPNKTTQAEAFGYIDVFKERGLISNREHLIMKFALSDNTLSLSNEKDGLRSEILKAMLISILK